MPSTIPYDPSLSLGNIVPLEKLTTLENIAKAQAPVDAAQEKLNAALLALRSLDLTRTEMAGLGIDTKPLDDKRNAAGEKVAKAAQDLVDKRLGSLDQISDLRSKLSTVTDSPESPVDFNRTEIKKMPLAADSLNLDAQFFSFDENEEKANNSLAAVRAFVSASTKVLGTSRAGEITNDVHSALSAQRAHHDIEGTLVITATCTHKEALLLAPFIIDVDKGIRVWNTVFDKKKIDTSDAKNMSEIAKNQTEPEHLSILSGATYGSSFVGMVHVLRSSETTSTQKMLAVASSLQAQMKVGGWFASQEGGFGVSSTFANDAKQLLSSQQINSHVSLVTVGNIPSIKSNTVKVGVKAFAEFDGKSMMDKLSTLANSTQTEQESVQESAKAARTGGQMMAIRGAEIKSVMLGLKDIDEEENKLLDVNTMMTAFEDYVEKALTGEIGAPITYYIKPITRSQLAQMWVAKYLPNTFVTSQGDDSQPAPAPAPAPAV